MSKIGKIPVLIPVGVKITEKERKITVAGSKGTMFFMLPSLIDVKIESDRVIVVPKNNFSSSLFGLTRAIIANLVKGVTVGFEKKLELSGVGYRAQVSGNDLMLFLGFSHPVKIPAVEGITFKVLENVITVSGIDKNLVGDIAAKIRTMRVPDPYKGKGIRYTGEHVRRKAGKAAKAAGK